jgi:hypothetical protein
MKRVGQILAVTLLLVACGPEGGDAQKVLNQSLQQAAPAARGIDGSGHHTGSSTTTCNGKDPSCADDANTTDESYPVPNLGYVDPRRYG